MSLPLVIPRNALDRMIDDLCDQHTRRSRIEWAADMLALDVRVTESIRLGRPVLARQLDAVAVRRALRGEPLPSPDNYFRVRLGHALAVDEGGPFHSKSSRR